MTYSDSPDSPLVSIIVPAFNAEQYLEECLLSILGQTYRTIELIVVDDGSTDRTASIIKSFSDRNVRYVHQPNSGSCAAPRNKGLALSNGEFITFFDADDVMTPTKIEAQVNDLVHEPDAVMSICNYRNFTETQKGQEHFASCPELSGLLAQEDASTLILAPQQTRRLLIEENFSIASSPLFRAAALKSQHGFNERLKACEDFHLIYRIAMLGPVILNTTVGFGRRLHDLNMSGDDERMLRNYVASRTDLLALEEDPAIRRQLTQKCHHLRRSLQACLARNGKLTEALALYRQTLPPRSLRELNHDFRQAVKILLLKLRLLKPEKT